MWGQHTRCHRSSRMRVYAPFSGLLGVFEERGYGSSHLRTVTPSSLSGYEPVNYGSISPQWLIAAVSIRVNSSISTLTPVKKLRANPKFSFSAIRSYLMGSWLYRILIFQDTFIVWLRNSVAFNGQYQHAAKPAANIAKIAIILSATPVCSVTKVANVSKVENLTKNKQTTRWQRIKGALSQRSFIFTCKEPFTPVCFVLKSDGALSNESMALHKQEKL